LWERKDILAFCLAFPLECAKQAKKSQNIGFFIFGYPFSFSIGDALTKEKAITIVNGWATLLLSSPRLSIPFR